MNANPLRRATAIATLLIPAATAAVAEPVFRDWAQVVAVEPQVEVHYVERVRTRCDETGSVAFEQLPLAPTVGEDVRRQWQLARRCREVVERQPVEQVTGYRVTYRYRGHTEVRYLDYDPGERLPVEVSLSAAE